MSAPNIYRALAFSILFMGISPNVVASSVNENLEIQKHVLEFLTYRINMMMNLSAPNLEEDPLASFGYTNTTGKEKMLSSKPWLDVILDRKNKTKGHALPDSILTLELELLGFSYMRPTWENNPFASFQKKLGGHLERFCSKTEVNLEKNDTIFRVNDQEKIASFCGLIKRDVDAGEVKGWEEKILFNLEEYDALMRGVYGYEPFSKLSNLELLFPHKNKKH